ncbi:MAG TPA: hypothetical protein VF721_18540 [Pyrinomonadaceae bacterium]|jgi:hypothetical protein
MADSYQVFIDDNYHYMDESERYKHGDFASFEEALAACKAIVDDCLQGSYEKGMTAGQLYVVYTGFGEDPFIVGEPAPFRFSAWDYAKERCSQICGES